MCPGAGRHLDKVRQEPMWSRGRKTKAVSQPWAPSFPWDALVHSGLCGPTNTRWAQTGGEQEVCIVPQKTSVPNSGDALRGSQRAAVSLLPKC